MPNHDVVAPREATPLSFRVFASWQSTLPQRGSPTQRGRPRTTVPPEKPPGYDRPMIGSSTPSLRVRAAATLSLPDIVALFNLAYSDYSVPMHLTQATLLRMLDLFALDLRASRIGMARGAPAALALLGLREQRAWLAGVGVVPAMRGRGFGTAITEAAIEQARAHEAREVWLEVLESNFAARRIYDGLGFNTVRRLGVWVRPASHPGAVIATPAESLRDCAAPEAFKLLAPQRRGRAPWQRDSNALASGLPYYYGVVTGELADPTAVALYSVAPEVVDVMEIVSCTRDPAQRHAGAILDGLIARYPERALRMVNYAEDDPLIPLFAAAGATVLWWQHEMLLRG